MPDEWQTDFESHRASVYRFALNLTKNSADAEDLTQECFLRLQRQSTQLDQLDSIRRWLFKITYRIWIDSIRSRQRRPTSEIDADFPDQRFAAPDHRLVQQESIAVAMEAMSSLPVRQREVLYLKTVEELSIEAISLVLETSKASVKASLSLARKQMRERLAARNQPELS